MVMRQVEGLANESAGLLWSAHGQAGARGARAEDRLTRGAAQGRACQSQAELKWGSWGHGIVGQGHQGPLVPSGHTTLGGLNAFCCFDFDFKNTES